MVVVPGTGLGGRVFTQRWPFLVPDYIASEGITHEYDLAVSRERLTSMAAVPVVVRGDARAVLYLASRDRAPLSETALREAMDAAALRESSEESVLALGRVFGHEERGPGAAVPAGRRAKVLALLEFQ